MRIAKIPYLAILFGFVLLNLIQHRSYLNLDIQGIHAWRQSQTMWNIRNFSRHDANILNPKVAALNAGVHENIYRYEFPVMQWTIAMVQKVAGEEIIIVRLCVFMISMCSILGMFFLMNTIVGNYLTACVTAILFQYSKVFFYYSINPIPDKLPFLMFSVISIVFFVHQMNKAKTIKFSMLFFPGIQLLMISPALVWYIWVMPNWGDNLVLTGIMDQKLFSEEHLEILKYHYNIMLPKLLLTKPTWIPAILGLIYLILNRFKTG